LAGYLACFYPHISPFVALLLEKRRILARIRELLSAH